MRVPQRGTGADHSVVAMRAIMCLDLDRGDCQRQRLVGDFHVPNTLDTQSPSQYTSHC